VTIPSSLLYLSRPPRKPGGELTFRRGEVGARELERCARRGGKDGCADRGRGSLRREEDRRYAGGRVPAAILAEKADLWRSSPQDLP